MTTKREFSAGGLLVQPGAEGWELAAIRPAGKPAGIWALPKGRVDPGEEPEAAALREVAEETGAYGRSLGKLGDTRYVYTWGGRRIFKVVSFYLVRYEGGTLGELPEAFRHEVAEVRWLALADAPGLLAYGGEQDMARAAAARLAEDDVSSSPCRPSR